MPKDKNHLIVRAVRNEFLRALERAEDDDQGATPAWTKASLEDLEGAGREALAALHNLAEGWITIESLGTPTALKAMQADIKININILKEAHCALDGLLDAQAALSEAEGAQEEAQITFLQAAMSFTGLEDGIE